MKIKYQGIYGIFDKDGSCWYIGQSIDIERRWKTHKTKKYKDDNWHNEMQSRLDDFTFKILELVDDIDKLLEREAYYIEKLQPKYTTIEANIGSQVGPLSEETRNNVSLSLTGITRTEAMKQHISNVRLSKKIKWVNKNNTELQICEDELQDYLNDGWKHGRLPLSDDIKMQISNTLKGKYTGENAGFYGKHHTEEANKKNSLAHKGLYKDLIWITNGIENYRKTVDEYETIYKQKNFKKGMTRSRNKNV